MAVQRGCLQREINRQVAEGGLGLKERYSLITGKVHQTCVLPGNAKTSTVAPVTVRFVDYLGQGTKLPKLSDSLHAGTRAQRYSVVPCQVTCASKGLATPYGLAPPGAKMVSLHIANHSGRAQNLMQGETLCLSLIHI